MMQSKVETIDPSVNVLMQNLIALNTSLFKENEEKNKQLIDIKKKLLEEEEESTKLRSQVDQYQQDLMHKNHRIVQLTSQLKAVRQLTDEVLSDDCNEIAHLLVKDENRQAIQQVTSTPITSNGNEISSHRKISLFFQKGYTDTEIKSSVKKNSDSSFNGTESAVNVRNSQEIKSENLLIPLHEIKRPEMLHNGVRPFACDKCSKMFARSDYLENHMRSHSGNNQRNASSSKKVLNESSSFSGSKKLVNESSSFQCDLCGLKYLYKHNLLRHKRNVHAKSI